MSPFNQDTDIEIGGSFAVCCFSFFLQSCCGVLLLALVLFCSYFLFCRLKFCGVHNNIASSVSVSSFVALLNNNLDRTFFLAIFQNKKNRCLP